MFAVGPEFTLDRSAMHGLCAYHSSVCFPSIIGIVLKTIVFKNNFKKHYFKTTKDCFKNKLLQITYKPA